jgi:hypothetical protein
MRRINIFRVAIIGLFINFLTCSRGWCQSFSKIDTTFVLSNDSIRLAFVYTRNKEFFLQGFKMLRIRGDSEIFLFSQHYYLKTGYIIWKGKKHYQAAFYSINHKLITNIKNHKDRKVIVENYFNIYNNIKAICREVSVPEVTSIPQLTTDLVRLNVNGNTIYSVNVDKVSRIDINSQSLLKLDSLARYRPRSLPPF